jgi:hypothetical protein
MNYTVFLYTGFNLCMFYYLLIKHGLLPQTKLTDPFCKSDNDSILRNVGIQLIYMWLRICKNSKCETLHCVQYYTTLYTSLTFSRLMTYIYIYMSYRAANLHTFHFMYLFNKYT